MLRYDDKTGHYHVWVPIYGDLDLRTCDPQKIAWPITERKGSWLHRLALRYWRGRNFA